VGDYEEGNFHENVANFMRRFNSTTLVAGLVQCWGQIPEPGPDMMETVHATGRFSA
jgi:hypothetical protein